MHRSLPQSGSLFRTLLFFDALAGAVGYGMWRWLERNDASLLAAPRARLAIELVLVVGAALLAAALVRWAVYRSSSWEPDFLVALGAVVMTPLVGAWLMRSSAAAEFGRRPEVSAGMSLPHQTSYSRIGNTKRLSEL